MVTFPTITVLADAFFYDMRMNKAVRRKAAAMTLDRMFKTMDAKRPSTLANIYYRTYLKRCISNISVNGFGAFKNMISVLAAPASHRSFTWKKA
jgi:hypothetical protein